MWWPYSRNLEIWGSEPQSVLYKHKERNWHLQQIAVFFENLSFGIMIDIKRMPFNSWLNEWSVIIIDGSIKHWKYTKYMNIVQYQYRWVWVVQILIYYQQLFCYFPATTIDWTPGKALVIPSLTSRKLIQWNDVSN